MLKLVRMKVLLVGAGGIGIETVRPFCETYLVFPTFCIFPVGWMDPHWRRHSQLSTQSPQAKNTVLAGVHTLTLFDPEPTRIEDCGANFFLTEGDVGKPRGEVCAPKLAELNDEVRCGRLFFEPRTLPHQAVLCDMWRGADQWRLSRAQVNVVAAKEDGLTEELVAAHNCVVFTVFTPIEELLRWNKFCRTQKQPISFMYCFSAGTAGSLFVDHGPGFVMRDPDGKNPLVKMIDEVCLEFLVVSRVSG